MFGRKVFDRKKFGQKKFGRIFFGAEIFFSGVSLSDAARKIFIYLLSVIRYPMGSKIFIYLSDIRWGSGKIDIYFLSYNLVTRTVS